MPSSSSSSAPTSASAPRCPLALQEIFLASNSGNEVHTPPPANMACKTFQRADWNFHHAQQQQMQQHRGGNNKRSLLLLNPFSRATALTPSTTSLLGVSKGRVTSLSQRIAPLVQQQQQQHDDPLLAVLPNVSDEDKKRMSPQEFLNALLQEDPQRAKYYSTESYNVKDSAYYNQPTAFQLSSYGSYLTDMIRRSDANGLRDMLVMFCNSNNEREGQMGLSPNACNIYGESIVTMICRRGVLKLLQVLMDTGCCSLQVSDDCGRTPLHDACWSSSQPCFAVIETILQADARLFYMKDARGSLPLDYVPKQHWDAWKRFLVKAVDVYFPIIVNDQDEHQGPPELTKYAPNSRPVSTPPNSLPNALAAMVAFGKLTPDEARMMATPDDDNTDDDDDDDDVASTVDSSSNYDENDVDDDDWSSSSNTSSDSEDYDSDNEEEDYDSHSDEDDDSYEGCAMNHHPDDMDRVMTGSLLTGKLL